MSGERFKCSECEAVFETSQALGSHVRYKHRGKKSASPREGLDLKSAFVDLLHDVGVRRGARTITEIYFGMGADSMDNLDRVLRLSGVSNPARALVLSRWGQRVNRQVGETMLRSENLNQRGSGNVFEAYERMRESDLKELLMDDLRARIEERRKKTVRAPGDEDRVLRRIDRLAEEVRRLRPPQTISKPLTPGLMPLRLLPQPTRSYAYPCDDPYHPESCVICGNCGFHGSIAQIKIGGVFLCPICGNDYIRDHW